MMDVIDNSYVCDVCAEGEVIPRAHEVDPDSKVHVANMGTTWGRQDPGGPHVGPMILAIWGVCGSTNRWLLIFLLLAPTHRYTFLWLWPAI